MNLGREDLNINNAFSTYRDMKLDGVVSGSMSFIKAVLAKDFHVVAKEGATAKEVATTKAINQSLDALPYDKRRLVSGWMQMLDYGCSLHEVVLKRDARGYIVFENISPIHLTNVSKFVFEKGNIKSVDLTAPENDGLVQQSAFGESGSIDGDKLLLFRLEPDSDFPLGKSLLYGAYTGWKTKKILQEYEAIGVAKNLSGVLDIAAPSDYINKYFSEPNSDEAIYIDNLLQQAEMLHAGKGSYVLRASDTNANGVSLFNISSIGGSAQTYDVGKAITRYNQEIQLSLQTMVLSLGVEGGGSFALSDNSTHLMTLFIENIRDVVSYEFKKTLRNVWAANGNSPDSVPELVWGDIEPVDWDEFTKGWQRLLQSGGVTPTEDLESFFREAGEAPQADYTKKIYNKTNADSSERLDDGKTG